MKNNLNIVNANIRKHSYNFTITQDLVCCRISNYILMLHHLGTVEKHRFTCCFVTY